MGEQRRNEENTGPMIGEVIPDGTVYAGNSPDTGKAMYTTPADAPAVYTFHKARAYASRLEAHGHRDWRIPTQSELDVLFTNHARIGGFNETGLPQAEWYWSCSQNNYGYAWGQRFSDGNQCSYSKVDDSSVRCVRG